ncbi:MAG: hypothetical protein UDQ58_06670 [Desulfovibrio sp.]|nr:hypothetical protein [Desulfovibrio sp.]
MNESFLVLFRKIPVSTEDGLFTAQKDAAIKINACTFDTVDSFILGISGDLAEIEDAPLQHDFALTAPNLHPIASKIWGRGCDDEILINFIH